MRGAVAGGGDWRGMARAVIGEGPLNKKSRRALRLAGFGFAAWVTVRLVLGASSIPPSKEDDEPKNHEYEEQAEHAGTGRECARVGGSRAALL